MEDLHPWVKWERNAYKDKYSILVEKLDLSKPLKILDYGSGTGGFSSLLAEYHPHLQITAVDSNEKAIKLGRESYGHLPNLEFILSKEIPKKKYDLIFKNMVLHELNGKGDRKIINSFLKKAYDSLNEGGLISVLDNHRVPEEVFRKIYEKNRSPIRGTFEEEYKEHNRYTLQEWKEMLEKPGFYTEQNVKLPPNLFHYVGKKKSS